ncbi:MAG: hypothetical protein DI626_00290 [Micavibrio aeruginosavorus]|uniref:Uncharacterized protein n=1 Tax=Micavibrio aeruginosavorus TaxID=349221 RepID=A0A2W5A371_9BACT|nr:MAG: hypothetical protein DI626_00290 [Micavibrio aeruginosavorus]
MGADSYRISTKHLLLTVIFGPLLGWLVVTIIYAGLFYIFGNKDQAILSAGFSGTALTFGYPVCLLAVGWRIRRCEEKGVSVKSTATKTGLITGAILGLLPIIVHPHLFFLSVFTGIGFGLGIGTLYDFFEKESSSRGEVTKNEKND